MRRATVRVLAAIVAVAAVALLSAGAAAAQDEDPQYPPTTVDEGGPAAGSGPGGEQAETSEPSDIGEAAPTADESSILPVVFVLAGIAAVVVGGAWLIRRTT